MNEKNVSIPKSTIAAITALIGAVLAVAVAFKAGQAATVPDLPTLVKGPVVILVAVLFMLVEIGLCAFVFVLGAEHGSEEEKDKLRKLQDQVNRDLRIANSEMRRSLDISRTQPAIKDRSIKFYKYIKAVFDGEYDIGTAMELANRYYRQEKGSMLIKAIPEQDQTP